MANDKEKSRRGTAPDYHRLDGDGDDDLLSRIAEDEARAREIFGVDADSMPVVDRGVMNGHPLTDDQRWRITLVDGRTISLESLHQYRVYAGMLCGAPMAVDSELSAAVRQATQLFKNHGAAPVVLPPVVSAGSFADSEFEGRIFPGLPCRILPKICCIAVSQIDL